MTVKIALIMWAQVRAVPKESVMFEVRSICKLFQLEPHLNKYGHELNKYQCRLLTLAMTFIGAPKLILLDHPTGQVCFVLGGNRLCN